MALLTAINDLANEEADGSNWTYQVNDESADRSFEVYQLRPNDRVLVDVEVPIKCGVFGAC